MRSLKKISGFALVGAVLTLALVLASAWLLNFTSQQSSPPDLALTDQQTTELRSGDLVFRKGSSALSSAVQTYDKEGIYTHVGILAKRGNKLEVLHVEPGADMGHVEAAKAEPLHDFLQGSRAWSIYRFEGLAEQQGAGDRVVDIAGRYVKEKIRFDRAMDHSDDTELYCTELVWRALAEATSRELLLEESRFKTPLGSWSVILPSAITGNANFTEILKSTSDRRLK